MKDDPNVNEIEEVDDQGSDTPEGSGTGENSTGAKGGAKTFTQEEVNKMIQKRLTQEKARWENANKPDLTVKKNTSEGRKLQDILDQNNQAEINKAILSQLEALRRERDHSELLSTTQKALADISGSAVNFAEMLVGDDAESTSANIEKFKTAWNTALNGEVESRLKGNPPKTSKGTKASGTNDLYTQEEIAKMKPEEIQKNWDKVNKSLKALRG